MRHRNVVWVLIAILIVPGLASAIRQARLIGRAVDQDGKPIEGVTVTVTSRNIPDFNKVETTDRKGIFKVDFEQVDVTYHYRFEKVGYKILEIDQRWSLVGTKHHDFKMQPGQTVAAEGEPPASTSQPAITAYNAGAHAFGAKDYESAVAKFREAVGYDPELRQAWGALSAAELELKHYQEAADAAEKAIALGSTDELMLQSRWEAYRRLGDEAKTEEARQDLEKAGRLTEEAKKIYNEGVASLKAGDDEGAFTKFQEAVETDPNLKVALLALATTGLKIGRHQEALTAAETVLKEDAQNENAARLRYNASLALGDKEKLADALVGLAPYEPKLARDGLLALAFEAYDASDMERAKELFARVLTVDPNHAQCHYYLGLIFVNEGDKEQATSHLESFLRLAPDDPNADTATQLLAYLKKPSSS